VGFMAQQAFRLEARRVLVLGFLYAQLFAYIGPYCIISENVIGNHRYVRNF